MWLVGAKKHLCYSILVSWWWFVSFECWHPYKVLFLGVEPGRLWPDSVCLRFPYVAWMTIVKSHFFGPFLSSVVGWRVVFGLGVRVPHVCVFPHVSSWQYVKSQQSRLRQRSFFSNDAMVMFFFQGTIANDGFSMVLLLPVHYHWMFFCWLTIDNNGFSMVFPKFRYVGQRWFWLWKDQKNA